MEVDDPLEELRREVAFRKGTHGVSTTGVTANFSILGRGTFCVLPLTYLRGGFSGKHRRDLWPR